MDVLTNARYKNKRRNREAGALLPDPRHLSYQAGQNSGQGHGEAQFNRQHLQELQEKYEAFEKRFSNLPPEYQHVVEYVHSLDSLRRAAEESLRNVERKAESLLKEVNGNETVRDISQSGSTNDIIDFIFGGYKDQSDLLKTHQWHIRQLNESVHQLQEDKKLSESEVEARRRECHHLVKNYEQKLGQERAHHTQELNQERSRRIQELDQERSHHEQKLEGERFLFTEKLQKLIEDNNNEVKALKNEHENRVNELKGDIRTLQNAAIDHVDRFTPRPDSELRGQFKQLKSSVRSVARSPWDTGSQNLEESAHIRAFIQTTPEQHHKYALESKLWSILVEGIFATPFKVLGGYGDCFFTSWCKLHQDCMFSLLNAALINDLNYKQRDVRTILCLTGLLSALAPRNGGLVLSKCWPDYCLRTIG